MRLTIHGPNLFDQSNGTFHVHAADCADNTREIRRNGSVDPYTGDFATVEEVVDFCYPPDEFECESGEYVHDFHFLPCCGLEA